MENDGIQFEIETEDWRWSLASESVWLELGPCPEKPGRRGRVVKESEVRSVFQRDGFYVKVERPEPKFGISLLKAWISPKAKAEFDAARALNEAGVPCVEAVGYGSSGADQALITKAFEGSVSVNDFLQERFVETGADPEGFITEWTKFVLKVLHSGFKHPDFHNGNILFSEKSGEFKLVDVLGVKKDDSFDPEPMRRILFETRRALKPARLIALAKELGAPGDAEDYVARGLAAEAARLEEEWPKRKAQLLAGYSKFAVKVLGSSWPLLNRARRPLWSPEIPETKFDKGYGEDALLKAFKLELAGLPHRRAVAWNPCDQEILFEKTLPPGLIPQKELDDLDFYAKPFGADIRERELARDLKGRLVIKN